LYILNEISRLFLIKCSVYKGEMCGSQEKGMAVLFAVPFLYRFFASFIVIQSGANKFIGQQ